MKIRTIINILVLAPLFSFAQQSEAYFELMNNLIPIDSSKIETSFSNEKPKYIGTTTDYEYMGKEYVFLTGKHIRYYKGGSRTEGAYNSWGTVLTNKHFDKNGNLISDSKTITLDTSAKNLKEFEDSSKHITFVIKTNDYKYSSDLNKHYLYLKSEHTNGEKSGTWE